MRKHFRCLVVICVLVLSPISMAESISGNQYLNLSEKERGWYFLGVLDAIKQTRDTYSKATEMTKSDFDHIWESCISGRPVRQHLAIVDLWLKNNPIRWHEPAIQLIFDAERDSCDALDKD